MGCLAASPSTRSGSVSAQEGQFPRSIPVYASLLHGDLLVKLGLFQKVSELESNPSGLASVRLKAPTPRPAPRSALPTGCPWRCSKSVLGRNLSNWASVLAKGHSRKLHSSCVQLDEDHVNGLVVSVSGSLLIHRSL